MAGHPRPILLMPKAGPVKVNGPFFRLEPIDGKLHRPRDGGSWGRWIECRQQFADGVAGRKRQGQVLMPNLAPPIAFSAT